MTEKFLAFCERQTGSGVRFEGRVLLRGGAGMPGKSGTLPGRAGFCAGGRISGPALRVLLSREASTGPCRIFI